MSTGVHVEAVAAPYEAITAMRERYRRELACQIVHDSWHVRGFTSSYVLRAEGRLAGYGSVGGAPRDPKHTVKELYVLPPFRHASLALFCALVAASGARTIEAQTNDPFLRPMLTACAVEVSCSTILFEDRLQTRHAPIGVAFRRLTHAERRDVFPHTHEDVGEYGLESGGTIVATGGITSHYNPPYSDIYMEVAVPYRRRGLGSFLVQELKRLCYEAQRTPAARCDEANVPSRRTLERAGMSPCARILRGTFGECAREDSNLRPTD